MFFFSSRRRHTRFDCDWSSDVCSSDLKLFGRCRCQEKFGSKRPESSIWSRSSISSARECRNREQLGRPLNRFLHPAAGASVKSQDNSCRPASAPRRCHLSSRAFTPWTKRRLTQPPVLYVLYANPHP